MRKFDLLTLTGIVFILFLLSFRSIAQTSSPTELVPKNSLIGAPVSCIQPVVNFRVPPQLLDRAKLKARLAVLLRESLDDDSRGIFNVAREKEIKKLADKVRNFKAD